MTEAFEPLPGDVLGTAPPEFSQEQAREAAWLHWGIEGEFRRLTSERDVNWHLSSGAGEFVLKLTNPAEPAEVTEFQTLAHLHLAPQGLPVPRVIAARSGEAIVRTGQGRLRLLTYLPGRMMHQVPMGAGLRASVGEMNARLARGLAGFSHSAARHHLQWDIRHTGGLVPLLGDLPADLRPMVETFVRGFEADYGAALAQCRWQVVHGDMNPHNLVVTEDGAAVAGVLDFGDMVETPLICDLGVSASYVVDAARPLASLGEFARAYHAVNPLTRHEAGLILAMTKARWVTTLCITASRAARYPQNAAYILRNVPAARAGLAAFAGLDPAAVTAHLLKELDLS